MYQLQIIFKQWWFLNNYIILFFISPFLNWVILKINKKNYEKLLIILILIFSIANTICPIFNGDNGFGVSNFIILYFIGAYIRRYYKCEVNKLFYIVGYISSSLAIVLGNHIITIITGINSSKFYSYDNIFVIIGSICLFLFFSNLKIKSNLINNISKLSFGTYIIHTQPIVWSFLITNIFQTYSKSNNYYFIKILIWTFSAFLICAIIEKLRIMIITKIEDKLLNSKIYINISGNVEKFLKII